METHTDEASSREQTERIAEVENGNKSNEQLENSSSNLKSDVDSESSDDVDDEGPVTRKKRLQRFSDSNSEAEKDIVDETNLIVERAQSEDSNDSGAYKSPPNKSRIRLVSADTDSDSHSDSCHTIPTKNGEQQARLKNKRNKIKQMFESLVTSRLKEPESVNDKLEVNEFIDKSDKPSDMSDDEASSIEKIRQKINERTMHLKSTIYDPDTSEEEDIPHKNIQKQKKSRKSTKLTSPKPVRMSAKQAMENMQKIRSESNRMLREKEVSLPYHRPKALSLKDIMSRRRPAVSSDGKALPIKMNEDQLKQYVVLLEQRQKDIMELCKSDTEEDDKEEVITDTLSKGISTADMSSNNDTIYDDLIKTTVKETNICDDDDVNNQTKIFKENPVNVNVTEKTEGYISNTKVITSNVDDKTENNTSNKENPGSNNNLSESASKENKSISGDIKTNFIIANTSKDDPESNIFEGNISAEMKLVYNDSLEDTNDNTIAANGKDAQIIAEKITQVTENSGQQCSDVGTETDSQMFFLHYNTEKSDDNSEQLDNVSNELEDMDITSKHIEEGAIIENENNNFPDDDMNMEDIDKLIENAEILSKTQGDSLNSPMHIRDSQPLNTKPKLTGAPGMIIDLDGTDPFAIKKLTGVELLKERFAYFAKLKTPEEMEREREKRIKPGLQHLKLKQKLEEKMAEQRSIEWAERLQEEKQHQIEIDALRGDESDAEEDIDKIEAKLEENEDVQKESSSESAEEEELIEEKEKPRKWNPLIADEAEESDCDEFQDRQPNGEEEKVSNNENDDEFDNNKESDEESSEEEESDEEEVKRKKGRILKAFEDSDDEDAATKVNYKETVVNSINIPSSNTHKASVLVENCVSDLDKASNLIENHAQSPTVKGTQDDELQLAQMHKSLSDDLFTSQESDLRVSNGQEQSTNKNVDSGSDKNLGTQTFSLNPDISKPDVLHFAYPDNLAIVGDTQTCDEGNLDHIVGMCSGSFSQNLVTSQYQTTQHSQSDDIGEDVLALCTGKFYDNQFLSQLEDDVTNTISQKTIDSQNYCVQYNYYIEDKEMEQEVNCSNNDGTDNQMDENEASYVYHKEITHEVIQNDNNTNKMTQQITINATSIKDDKDDNNGLKNYEKNLLSSILDELNDPEFESPKTNKYFVGDDNQDKENKLNIANGPIKKKFIIDSDDEENEGAKEKKKKFKKRKLEKRALHISDDEEDDGQYEQDQEADEISDIEDDTEILVEYDSEENEVEIRPEVRRKKRKVTDFFEQEAELTSEDEWAGSGDEDEGGLDRMEREAGDDDTFHQGRLQRELGQIHMREVLDQDKREVRLIQELLFEDGDLGGGHRQRKFRWRNEDGEEETGTAYKEFADTQEEEFESEEQWRKQRHEREMFLKQMQKQDEAEDSVNTSVNRTTIIKANLCSKTMSSLLLEVDASTTEKTESPASEKKTAKDIPSPKKTFTMFQQNSHSSLLARGHGMLARLATLTTPLAAGDDAPKASSLAPSSKRNFVFATLTQEEKPKVTKRKADRNVVTPKLVKKIKTEDKKRYPKSSLLDHIKT